jgi:exopolysaccharide biosynthesis polyprenyl glycosylphosphotransferase
MKRNNRYSGFSPAALPLVTIDALLLLSAAQICALLTLGQTLSMDTGCARTLWIGILTLLLALVASGCYSPWQMDLRGGQGRILFRGLTRGLAAFGLELGLGIAGHCARSWALPWAGVTLVSLPVSRLAIASGIRALQRRGFGVRNLVLVTAGTDYALQELLAADPGYRVRDSLDIDDLTRNWKLLPQRVRQGQADEVWIFLPASRSHLVQEVPDALWDAPVAVLLVHEFWESRLISSAVRPLAEGGYALMLTATPLDEWHNRTLKRIEDLVLAALIGLLILPVCGLIALAVRVSSPGPVLFRQRRHGLGGTAIEVYKFRTMYVDGDEILARDPAAKAELERNHKLKDDPRITRLGKLLRKASLDELPQIFNVLRNEMSLVGPRMISPQEMEMYSTLGMNLLTVHPGITGLWQVNGRSDVSYQERVRLDMFYIRNWNIWLDLQLLLQTIPAVLKSRGAY